jgi:CHAT domain-containing protein
MNLFNRLKKCWSLLKFKLFFLSFVFAILLESTGSLHESKAIASNSFASLDRGGFNFGSTSIATAHNAPAPSQVMQWADRGKTLFTSGQFAEANRIWKQAVQEYDLQNNLLEQARLLNYIALAYLNLGQLTEAKQNSLKSLNLIGSDFHSTLEVPETLARSWNTHGNIQLALGDAEAALSSWDNAVRYYQAADDAEGVLGSQISQIKALQNLGLYARSQSLLEQAIDGAKMTENLHLKITELRLLGEALYTLGELDRSQDLLTQSLILSRGLQQAVQLDETSDIWLSLGNTLQALGDPESAWQHYQQAIDTASNDRIQLRAILNQLHLLANHLEVGEETLQNFNERVNRVESILSHLPASRLGVDARVNLAESWMSLNEVYSFGETANLMADGIRLKPARLARILAEAVQQAKEIEDVQAESYALGTLAKLYETLHQYADARSLTERAVTIAKYLYAPELSFQWQWQLGRLLQQENKYTEAIASYKSAVELIKTLRRDVVIANPDIEFPFEEKIEPFYREFVALLLRSTQPDQPIAQTRLKQARDLMELLKLAELDNFFREACLEAKPQPIEAIDDTAAVIYPVFLPTESREETQIAVIVSLPGQPLFSYQTQVNTAQLETTIAQFKQYINPIFFDDDRLRVSQQLYDWLIRPALDRLSASGIQTLTFVLDTALQNVPLAALYDGDRYLIEQYSIAIAPGLHLLPSRSANTQALSAIVGGISQSSQGLAALPHVLEEIDAIRRDISAEILIDETFTTSKLQAKISHISAPIIHLATHGQFSSKANETFLVTWDSQLKIQDFAQLLRNRQDTFTQPIDLLVLSACQTATGDKRAALGLAGVAVRSGTRSVLASLWQVNDVSTATLMQVFYQQLTAQPAMEKAEVLRTAQLALLHDSQFQHPFYWASFVLVGNWV